MYALFANLYIYQHYSYLTYSMEEGNTYKQVYPDSPAEGYLDAGVIEFTEGEISGEVYPDSPAEGYLDAGLIEFTEGKLGEVSGMMS
jgi:hypothetical protein